MNFQCGTSYEVDVSGAHKRDYNSTKSSKVQLLRDITGHAKPGVLTALMGASGAGKTTLMDVLAGRKTQGKISGDILVNGKVKQQKMWSRVVGYVEQLDIHSAALTAKEAVEYSSQLRYASVALAFTCQVLYMDCGFLLTLHFICFLHCQAL